MFECFNWKRSQLTWKKSCRSRVRAARIGGFMTAPNHTRQASVLMELLLKMVLDLSEHSILPLLPSVKMSEEEVSRITTLSQRVDEMDL